MWPFGPQIPGECTFWHLFISLARDTLQCPPFQITQSLSALTVLNSLFFFLLYLAFPHLISLCFGTLPSASSIYCSFRGSGLLLVINTQVKWSVTLPGLARRQRCIGRAGTVPTRLPQQQQGCSLGCLTAIALFTVCKRMKTGMEMSGNWGGKDGRWHVCLNKGTGQLPEWMWSI